MSPLDHHRTLERLDPLHIAQTAERLPEQIRYGWEVAAETPLPAAWGACTNVVLCGMGGSGVAAEIALHATSASAKKPVTLCRDYTLPHYVNARSLVMVLSMSGTTEEMIALFEDARRKKAKCIILAGGGPLIALAKKHRTPVCHLEYADFGDSRYGTGIAFGALLHLLAKTKSMTTSWKEVEHAIQACHEVIDTCAPDISHAENPAKQIAEAIERQHVLVLAAEHLTGTAHAVTNALNETAKQQAHSHALPEYNHHYLEALQFPEKSATQTTALIIKSPLYHSRTQARCEYTADLLESTGATVVEYETGGGTALEEACEVLTMGFYLSLYTSVLHESNAADLPYVAALKQALAK